ncbi:hypothetical protein F4782DRAFT_331405 [Xylaria castorea]|nr:hypothetical protein F4782DRAFT_331405 [Xylaria castorea]
MQVLNAPSRDEVDTAHRKGMWLEIGVFSTRNMFAVSSFKTWCWLGLFATSIPIHLLFNSAIFRTEYRQSDFTVTIATEEFLNGGAYHPPGASLLTADGDVFFSGFGELFYLTQYITTGSGVEKNVSDAALHGNEWDKLGLSECRRQFGLYGARCNGLERYSDVILVIQNPDGWIRNEMWHLMDNQTRFWDQYIPPDEPNHLFYYTACTMTPTWSVDLNYCKNSCWEALGGAHQDFEDYKIKSYPFFVSAALYYANGTNNSPPDIQNNLTSGLQPGTFNLPVQYCLAKSFEKTCHIGVSPLLLLVVVLCAIVKASIAMLVTIVLGRQNQISLVTLGDCLASFIEQPDVETSSFSATANLRGIFMLPGRTQWQIPCRRRAVVIPRRLWFLSYSLFVLTISVSILFLFYSMYNNWGLFSGDFLAGSQNPLIQLSVPAFLGLVLIANAPQVLLSLWYFGFNNLFTHLQVANEWEQFATDYLPLRVTEPKGKQKSTYRLQLPYRYSLPLIALSASLHWLLSTTIYVIVSNGGYLDDYLFYDAGPSDPSLSAGTRAALGYSPISLFIVVVLSSILATIPVLFSLKRVSPHIVTLGSNSLLVSMACRVSPLSLAERSTTLAPDAVSKYSFLAYPLPISYTERNEETDSLLQLTTLRFPLGSHDEVGDREERGGVENGELCDDVQAEEPHSNMDNREATGDVEGGELHGNIEYTEPDGNVDDTSEDSAYTLQKVARSKIRWGVLKMPPEWLDEHDYEPLGFGVEGDEVTSPVEGKWYL